MIRGFLSLVVTAPYGLPPYFPAGGWLLRTYSVTDVVILRVLSLGAALHH